MRNYIVYQKTVAISGTYQRWHWRSCHSTVWLSVISNCSKAWSIFWSHEAGRRA